MAEIKRCTHTVFKDADAEKYLTEGDRADLRCLLSEIDAGRIGDGKEPTGEYIICNKDEPYANKILQIILDGEDEKSGIVPTPVPLTEDELRQLDGKPVYMFDLDKNQGAWDILTWDDDGNMYFVCQWLTHGNDVHSMIVDAVRNGKRVLYAQEVPGTDAVERMLSERNVGKN